MVKIPNPEGKPILTVDLSKVELVIRRKNHIRVVFDSGFDFQEDFLDDKVTADFFEEKFLSKIKKSNTFQLFVK